MISELHFLRPWWFLAIIPLLGLMVLLLRHKPRLQGWSEICDSHLLAHLVQHNSKKNQLPFLFAFLCGLLSLIIALTGPAWHKLPVPTYTPVQPRVLLLDMSEHMMHTDLTPNRMSRAKFKLRDLLARKAVGQIGLVAYTGEPFIVSPLTDDGQTIASLLSVLNPELMPVSGQNLARALEEAQQLIKQAGYTHGQILVLTSDAPSTAAMNVATKLAAAGIYSSIIPVRPEKDLNPLFQRFAQAGGGQLLPYSPDATDLQQWINHSPQKQLQKNSNDEIPVWRDEGRWFLIPALVLFLPLFQRGRLQRITS